MSRKLVFSRGIYRVLAGVVAALMVGQCPLAAAQAAGYVESEPPAATRVIRQAQLEQAAKGAITLRFSDVGQRSETSLDGVPLELSNLRVESQDDLIGVIDVLYPYYGFRGTESLVFYERNEVRTGTSEPRRPAYTFREDIDGIPTNHFVIVIVHSETKRILSIRRLFSSRLRRTAHHQSDL